MSATVIGVCSKNIINTKQIVANKEKSMKTVGFIMSSKENEHRRAILPPDIDSIKNKTFICIESGYGRNLGYSDDDYRDLGCRILSRDEILQCDIICDPKVGDAEYLNKLKNQTVFGWVHAVQNREITNKLISNKLTAICWEDMFDDERHVFWRNNEIAGEAAIMHAFQCFGIMPYNTKVALLGRGNVSNGALKILTLLGADVTVYSRNMEHLFKKELSIYDVVVNAILWDTSREDHIIYRKDLREWKKCKQNCLIIDISCDKNGGIETCVPTTIEKPIYETEGVLHYAVDHTPSLFYRTTTISISKSVAKYIDMIIEDKLNDVLINSVEVEKGIIKDKRIIEFQNR